MKKNNRPKPDVGAVVIGRNEGDRLDCCLNSVLDSISYVVYVDSGSTDNSIALARGLGIEVVVLDLSVPFTAARARNSGYRKLLNLYPELKYVQFIDGDCQLQDGWVKHSISFLDEHKIHGVVCGRRKERYPEHSIYNLLFDIELECPAGDTKVFGGDALIRVAAFESVGGFRDELIAGEEPELCVRLRRAGWQIWRLDIKMTLHDANMTRFSQWWKRSIRGGYAFAEGAYLHGRPPERHWVRETCRIWIWGIILPIIICSLAIIKPWITLFYLIYPLQVFRLALKGTRTPRINLISGFFLTLGKFPEGLGQIKFIYHLLSGKRGQLIEYK